jgi:hypothetical protein
VAWSGETLDLRLRPPPPHRQQSTSAMQLNVAISADEMADTL